MNIRNNSYQLYNSLQQSLILYNSSEDRHWSHEFSLRDAVQPVDMNIMIYTERNKKTRTVFSLNEGKYIKDIIYNFRNEYLRYLSYLLVKYEWKYYWELYNFDAQLCE